MTKQQYRGRREMLQRRNLQTLPYGDIKVDARKAWGEIMADQSCCLLG